MVSGCRAVVLGVFPALHAYWGECNEVVFGCPALALLTEPVGRIRENMSRRHGRMSGNDGAGQATTTHGRDVATPSPAGSLVAHGRLVRPSHVLAGSPLAACEARATWNAPRFSATDGNSADTAMVRPPGYQEP